ncbi:MAG: small acid-soluble spore protein SspI [[Clostridium] spiroforme]|uniref:Small acid-soluble spore protein SspI n=1 Tax=Thomasclavelia spiroformis TaxID=29348 RepID=A0A943ELH1_9FIRM|nr:MULTISPECIES: small acid-soluble spore protein SspI [Thomasclavelia]MBS5588882.1 small acid-soluble spore protein SspI [Thomasclavelia spiroformis]
MDIRNALLNKLHNTSFDELKEIINQGIASKEETILPGLGVLFEQYYNSLNNSQQNEIIKSLCELLK